jgi:putative glycosyltransferase (TIGR04372 family)
MLMIKTFMRKVKLANESMPTLTKNQLLANFPHYLSRLILIIVEIIFLLPLRFSNLLVSKKYSAFFANIALEKEDFKKAHPFIQKAKKYSKSRKLALHYELGLLEKESRTSLDQYLLDSISDAGILTNDMDHILSWAFWNLSHPRYQQLLAKSKEVLASNSNFIGLEKIRKLPEFTSNMGHMGYLVSYIGYYAKADPSREIELWPATAPNKYFMSLVLEQSPIKVRVSEGIPQRNEIGFLQKDSLALSRFNNDAWRIEHCSSAFASQGFPEVVDGQRFVLNFPTEHSQNCTDRLASIGFDTSRWFVILHIRGPKNDDLNQGQARDGLIGQYLEFCRAIQDLGGQVVRMGGKSFAPLKSNFPAIDYAQSEIASDDLDCFLWANCRWWTGNANGASLAAFAFGARRLISDQWFWDNVGPASDFYMPRLLSDERRTFGINETINHELSRNMNVSRFTQNGLKVRSISSVQLAQAAADLFENTIGGGNRNVESKVTLRLHPLETKFNLELQNSREGEFMRIPKSYLNFLGDTLDSTIK